MLDASNKCERHDIGLVRRVEQHQGNRRGDGTAHPASQNQNPASRSRGPTILMHLDPAAQRSSRISIPRPNDPHASRSRGLHIAVDAGRWQKPNGTTKPRAPRLRRPFRVVGLAHDPSMLAEWPAQTYQCARRLTPRTPRRTSQTRLNSNRARSAHCAHGLG